MPCSPAPSRERESRTAPVEILLAGIPAEIVREIGLRIRNVAIKQFDNFQQMGREVARGEARLVILSDILPTEDFIYVARRAKDAGEDMKIVYCISMQQAENALRALKDVHVDRFFLAPVDVEEMLLEIGKICKLDVVPPQALREEHSAAAFSEEWARARIPAFQMVDRLDDAAIALLENTLSAEVRTAAARDAESLAEIAARFGFQRAVQVAKEMVDQLGNASLSSAEGVILAERLLAFRQALSGPLVPRPRSGAPGTPSAAVPALGDPKLEDRRVLVIDDEPMLSRGLATLLGKRGLSVTTLNDPLQFWSVLDELKPNLILLDLEMPKISGTELCRVVRNDRRWSGIPVIFLTGHTDQASVQRIFAAGADDYVGKPFVPAELTMRIESRLAGFKARRTPLETDPLTGLATGGKATELIDRFLRLARRKSDPYSIAALQVDAFPKIASTFGRATAESVLRAIGELLPKTFRGEDVAGWWGGADFTIGMYGSNKEYAAIKLNQVCVKIAEQNFLSDDARRVHVSCSGGVAQFQTDGDTVAALRDSAVKAMAQIRESGGAGRVGISGINLAGSLTRRVDVVVIDDDQVLVTLLQHAMESRNMRVAIFADGEAAVAALTGNPPEVQAAVILLDVDLPALNGLEVLRRLKAGEVTRLSSVVMLTARTGERDILSALELGAIDHIPKPFSVPVLMHKVRAVLKQTQT
ncbi:MAG: response regulator [Gemmatimonadaceae bacterium]